MGCSLRCRRRDKEGNLLAGQGCYFAPLPIPQIIDGHLKGRGDGPLARLGAGQGGRHIVKTANLADFRVPLPQLG